MTDLPPSPEPNDDELLSAYLTDDLDQAAAEALQARLVREPDLAAALDELHASLVALRGLDAVQPPPGMHERLATRLAGAWDDLVPASERHDRAVTVPLRRHAGPGWRALTAVAAGVAVLAVAGLALVPAGGGDELALDDGAGSVEADAPAVEEGAAGDEAAGHMRAMDAGGVELPVVGVERVALDDAADVTTRYADAPEARALLGMGRAAAGELASRTRANLGGAPEAAELGATACAHAVEDAAGQELVFALVEPVAWGGADALAYVTVSASADALVLDRVDAWIVDPQTCVPRPFALHP
jgi:hypothetical protein